MSVERLCDQLNRDANKSAICSAMSELLLNSLYPRAECKDEDESIADYSREQIKRCLKFVRTFESAALVFYANLHKHTSIGSAIKLSVMLWNVLITQQEEKPGNEGSGESSVGGDENEDHENQNTSNKSKKTVKLKDSLARAKRSREEVSFLGQ